MLLAHSPLARRRMAALWSSLWATAQAFSAVRISGASTWEWLMDFRCSVSAMSKSSPREPVPEALAPHRAPELAGLLAVERQQIVHGVDAFFVEALLSARADAGQVAQGELAAALRARMSRGRATRPSGFSMSLATLAR